MSRIVLALGGNALGNSPQEQMNIVKTTAVPIVDLIEEGHEVIIAHGNGPQVGMINLAMEVSSNSDSKTPSMPFPECGAMSQGYIGYHLQNAIREELMKRSINKSVVSLITQVVVDENDEAFANPIKPIGQFYSKEEADLIAKEKSYDFVEDAGRGYRRVVPSPKPINIVEKDVIMTLIDAGHVVITVGGGGIPVVEKGNALVGVSAVIDKDFASAKVAELVDADMFIVLTAVDHIAINFGKPTQVELEVVTLDELDLYIKDNQFAPGSMLPKVLAAKQFVKASNGKKAIIASLEKSALAIQGKSGTSIIS